MKIITYCLTLIFMSSLTQLFAQLGKKSYRNAVENYEKQESKNEIIGQTAVAHAEGRDCISNPTIGETYNIKLGTPIIPVAFGRIEYKDGTYALGSAVNIGVGYTWVQGKATYTKEATLDVSPGFFYGIGIDTGVKPDGKDLLGTITGNVFIGFSKVALSGGYDLINKNVFFGLGTKIDIFRFGKNDVYTVKCLWKNPVPVSITSN